MAGKYGRKYRLDGGSRETLMIAPKSPTKDILRTLTSELKRENADKTTIKITMGDKKSSKGKARVRGSINILESI